MAGSSRAQYTKGGRSKSGPRTSIRRSLLDVLAPSLERIFPATFEESRELTQTTVLRSMFCCFLVHPPHVSNKIEEKKTNEVSVEECMLICTDITEIPSKIQGTPRKFDGASVWPRAPQYPIVPNTLRVYPIFRYSREPTSQVAASRG